MFLEDLAAHLEQKGCGTQGESIFIGHLPGDAKAAILLRDPPLGLPIEQEMIGYSVGRYLISIRHFSYPDGVALASQVRDALYLDSEDWPSVKVLRMRPVVEPMVYPLSTADQIELSVIFEVRFVSNS